MSRNIFYTIADPQDTTGRAIYASFAVSDNQGLLNNVPIKDMINPATKFNYIFCTDFNFSEFTSAKYLYDSGKATIRVYYCEDTAVLTFSSIPEFITFCKSVMCTTFSRTSKNTDTFINVPHTQNSKDIYINGFGTFAFTISGLNASSANVIVYDAQQDQQLNSETNNVQICDDPVITYPVTTYSLITPEIQTIPTTIISTGSWPLELINGVEIENYFEYATITITIPQEAITTKPKERYIHIQNNFSTDMQSINQYLPLRDIAKLIY